MTCFVRGVATFLAVVFLFIVESDCRKIRWDENVPSSDGDQEMITEKMNDLLNQWELKFQSEMSRMELENQQLAMELKQVQSDLLLLQSKDEDERLTRTRMMEERVFQLENQMAISNVEKKAETIALVDSAAISSNERNHLARSSFQQPAGSSVISEMPSSCQDLNVLGHNLNGFYLIKESDSIKIKTVYCDFNQTSDQDIETRIGYNDIKSSSSGIYFYVQRKTPFSADDSDIPFEVEKLNVGGGMNTTSGVFTAPVDGIYYFAFTGIKANAATNLSVFLKWNGVIQAMAESSEFYPNPDNYLSLTISLHSTLALKRGDEIKLWKYSSGTLHEDNGHATHFSGWLMQEDLLLE